MNSSKPPHSEIGTIPGFFQRNSRGRIPVRSPVSDGRGGQSGAPAAATSSRSSVSKILSTSDAKKICSGSSGAIPSAQRFRTDQFHRCSDSPHADNVDGLEKMGCRSAYHLATGLAHGEERDMTLRWIGKVSVPHFFHCDYIFVSGQLADHVESAQVGSMTDWVETGSPGRSDHCPVTADLSIT